MWRSDAVTCFSIALMVIGYSSREPRIAVLFLLGIAICMLSLLYRFKEYIEEIERKGGLTSE